VNVREARQISDRVMDEKRQAAQKIVESRYEKIIREAALQGQYEVEIKQCNDIEADVLKRSPYNFNIYKKEQEYGFHSYTINWEENPKFISCDV